MKPMNEDEKRSIVPAVLLAAACLWALAESLCGAPLRAVERQVNPYKWERPDWGSCLPGNGKSCRTEILAARCDVLAWTPNGESILTARCRDAYSGAAEIRTGRQWSLDHALPASRAWYARKWRNAKGGICNRAQGCSSFAVYYNDPRVLFETSIGENAEKGAQGPADSWCPDDRSILPALAKSWRYAARRYRLPVTPAEWSALTLWDQGRCAGGAK